MKNFLYFRYFISFCITGKNDHTQNTITDGSSVLFTKSTDQIIAKNDVFSEPFFSCCPIISILMSNGGLCFYLTRAESLCCLYMFFIENKLASKRPFAQ